MSKTDKTAPARIQARNKVASDPYRYTEAPSPRDRFHLSLIEGSEKTFTRETQRIFRASEIAQMEQFISEVETVTDRETERYGTRYHEVTTREIEVKEVTGYLQMDSGTPADPDTPWDEITRRVAVTERPAPVAKRYRKGLFPATYLVTPDYDVFKVVTVTETTTMVVMESDEQMRWKSQVWENKMFKRNHFDKTWNQEKMERLDDKEWKDQAREFMLNPTLIEEEVEEESQVRSERLHESSMLIYTSES